MAYKRTRKSLAEIGRELDATYLVESSMRSEGGRVRITSRLIRVPDQVQLWSTSYDSEPGSMLEFQREISAAIGERVRLQLSPERLSAIARRQTRNAEAYDLYLRGRYFWNQLSPVTTRRASEFFARATKLDPQYALAWSLTRRSRMSQLICEASGPGAEHSPWEVLEHLRIAQWDILEFSRKPDHKSPEFPGGYWPRTQAPPNEKAWEQSARLAWFGR